MSRVWLRLRLTHTIRHSPFILSVLSIVVMTTRQLTIYWCWHYITLFRSTCDSLQQCCLIFLSISSEQYSFYSDVLISHPSALLPKTVFIANSQLHLLLWLFEASDPSWEKFRGGTKFFSLFLAGSPVYSISLRTRLVSSLNYTKCVR